MTASFVTGCRCSHATLFLVIAVVCVTVVGSAVSQPALQLNPSDQQGSPSWEETIKTNNSLSIVFISFFGTRENGLQDKRTGTGFIVSAEGHVITCSHVVPPKREYSQLEVTGVVGARYGTGYPLDDVVDRLEQHDLVLLKLPPAATPWHSVQAITRSKAGASIVALGFALDANLLPAQGAITSLDAKGGRWLTSAPLNKGMSGGPVFDQTGAVVAIVAAGRPEAQLINELIPISFAKYFLLEIESPAVTKQNQAVQRSAEEFAKVKADLEKTRAELAAKQLSAKQSAKVDNLLEEGEKSKTEWEALYSEYLLLSRTEPGMKSVSDRQKVVDDLRHVTKEAGSVRSRLAPFKW